MYTDGTTWTPKGVMWRQEDMWRVLGGRGAVVVDDAGRPVEPGAAGWLAKAGAVPIGYYKDEEKTARLFKTVDGARMVVTDDRARAERETRLPLGEGVLGGSRARLPGGSLMWLFWATSLVATTRTCSNSDVPAVVLGRMR
ncbi:hypothetical protein [Nocardia sp. NPDC057440]|uniref:hypothetical protein n=1 Tax=Nocardia sp. NPDC057440 TaxID=3346134 RepID=UPI003672DF43